MSSNVPALITHDMNQLERMAVAVAKSNLFAVKKPEEALTLMLIAQAEGIHPAQAMTDYDLIQGKPSLKSYAMLARFQRAGGRVTWIKSTAEEVTGTFWHAQGGEITVTWDKKRCEDAGLAGRDMHKKFPLQMKRARCISEGVRAVYPACIHPGVYTPEETADMDVSPPEPISVEAAVRSFEHPQLSEQVIEALLGDIADAPDANSLRNAYQAAHKEALGAKDASAVGRIAIAYEARKEELLHVQTQETQNVGGTQL